jgi:capsular exopolysaccharide synthesis family protein
MRMNGETDLRALLGLLRRQFRLIVLTIIVIVAVAGVAAFTLTPIYSATSLILVDPSDKNLLEPENTSPLSASASTRIDSEVEILRSDSLLLDVVETEGLAQSSEWSPAPRWWSAVLQFVGLAERPALAPYETTTATLANLRRDYSVERRALTQVIALRVRSQNPQVAAQLANAIAETYIARQVASKVESTLAARELLLSRLIDARSELSAAEHAVGPPSADPQAIEASRRAEIARAQYEQLLLRVAELEAEAALQIADSRVVSPALAPQRPAFPDKMVLLVVALLLALGIGVGLAFLREHLIGGFTSQEQILALLKPAAATTVPSGPTLPTAPSVADLMVSAPLSTFSESVRRLRTIIDQQHAIRPRSGHVIAVASATPGEGKTTLSLSLARAYALSGQRTLLIDCDLREPSLHSHLDIAPMPGLRDFLDPKSTPSGLTAIAAGDPMTKVTLIGGASRSDVPTDQLLASTAFTQLVDAARASFEIVILDTPPLEPMVDGLYTAPHADSIVFAIHCGRTAQTDARKALDSLASAARPGTPVIAVLNQQQKPDRKSYRGYSHRYETILP